MNKNNIIWGIIIVAIGVCFLGNNLDLWNVDIFFDGWWTLFIIIPSFIGLFKRGSFFSSTLGLVIGLLLLLAAQDFIAWHMVGKIFIPVLIIMVGLSFIFKPNFKTKQISKKGKKEFVGIFSGCEEKVVDKFEGANCVAIFGGVDLDLRDADIKEDIVIECVSVFGGIDIKVPDNVIVKTSGVPVFGGVENKACSPKDKKTHTIYINYVCVFSGIDVL